MIDESTDDELSIEFVQHFILTHPLELQPTQNVLFFKRIKQFCKMLKRGEVPPLISVDDLAIVEGHHRYISGALGGKLPDICPGIRPKANEITSWNLVVVLNS